MRFVICLICAAILWSGASPESEIARARQLYATGDLKAAERILLDVLPAVGDEPAGAAAYTSLGVICHDLGRIQEAEHWHLKARAIVAPDSPVRVQVLNSLASLYLESNRPGEAERLIAEVNRLSVPSGDLAALAAANMAALQMVRGRNREAESLFLKVLDHWDRVGKSTEAAVVLNNLGILAMDRNDTRTALARLERSHKLWLEHMGGYHHSFLRTLANYGAVLLACGRATESERMLSQARSLAQQSHGADHEVTAQISVIYADALTAVGRKREASRIRATALRVPVTEAATVDVLDFEAQRR